jgi:hypothetical protein
MRPAHTITRLRAAGCKQLLLAAISCIGLALLTGCSSVRVEMSDQFPKPLVEELPYDVALVLAEEFRSYAYTEPDKKRKIGEVYLGAAHSAVFRNVLNEAFDEVAELDVLPEEHEFDLVFEPRIEDFQFALPAETKVDIYEVWVKYSVKVFDKNSQLLADWSVTAYGKSATETFATTAARFKEAVIIAMRDLGVNLVVELPREPGVKAWLAAREDTGAEAIQK